MEDKNISNKKEWIISIDLILRPKVFLPFFVSIILIYVNSVFINDKAISTILEIFAALFTGIAGSQFVDYWNKKIESNKIRLKASGAVRNLMGIDDKLKNIVGRIKAGADIEEIKNLTINLQFDVGNAKDDWGDIVDISEISKYRNEMLKKDQEIEILTNKITEAKSEKGSLIKKLEEKNKEKEELRDEFENYKSKNNLGMLGSASFSPSVSPLVSFRLCDKCHKTYLGTRGSLLTIGGTERNLCDECEQEP